MGTNLLPWDGGAWGSWLNFRQSCLCCPNFQKGTFAKTNFLQKYYRSLDQRNDAFGPIQFAESIPLPRINKTKYSVIQTRTSKKYTMRVAHPFIPLLFVGFIATIQWCLVPFPLWATHLYLSQFSIFALYSEIRDDKNKTSSPIRQGSRNNRVILLQPNPFLILSFTTVLMPTQPSDFFISEVRKTTSVYDIEYNEL